MRNLAILTFLTLDGVMEAPSGPEEDPSSGFIHGGWAANYWDDVMEQVRGEALAVPYDPSSLLCSAPPATPSSLATPSVAW